MSSQSSNQYCIQLLVLCMFFAIGYCQNVKLGVYLESLCPDSRKFINKQLTPTFNTLSQIFDIEFVPFGNSKWTYNQTTKEVVFTCQHGFQECYGNKIQSCFIAKAENNTQLIVSLIDCMFRSNKWKRPELSGKECANQLDVDWTAVSACSTGAYGTYLQLEMANKTASLSPPQNWIPWITIDGKHTDQIQSLAETDLQKLICDSYEGEKPYECKQKSIRDAKYESFPIGRYIYRNGIIEN